MECMEAGVEGTSCLPCSWVTHLVLMFFFFSFLCPKVRGKKSSQTLGCHKSHTRTTSLHLRTPEHLRVTQQESSTDPNQSRWRIQGRWGSGVGVASSQPITRGHSSPSWCICGGSHWPRRRRCTWGTSSGACRSAFSRTRSRRRGSTWSARRPSFASYSTGRSDAPGDEKRTEKYQSNQTAVWITQRLKEKPFNNPFPVKACLPTETEVPCNRWSPRSLSHHHWGCPLVSWLSPVFSSACRCPPAQQVTGKWEP